MAESSEQSRERWAKFPPSEAVLRGDSADVYFHRTLEILKKETLNPVTVMEVFPNGNGVICGMDETLALLKSKMESLGITQTPKEVFNEKYNHYKINWRELTKG